MATVLVVYGTGEGQTAKVASRITTTLEDEGHAAAAFDVDALPADLDLDDYDAVLVGASIHVGKHQKTVKAFVHEHLDSLAALPSGFFQVSLSAAIDDEEHRAEALGYVDDIIQETGWHPDKVAIFGGALRYSEYGFLTRSLLRYIARKETGDTDTSRDYEYTDWEEVGSFTTEFADFVEDQLAMRSVAETTVAE